MNQYQSPPWESSLIKGVPMALYDRAKLKQLFGNNIFVMFRGPRPATSGRSRINRQSMCVKQDAITFTVYRRKNG